MFLIIKLTIKQCNNKAILKTPKMKIVSSVLETVEGIQTYYIVGLLIFVILFVVILFRTFRMSKNETTIKKESIFDEEEKKEFNISN